MRKMTDLNLNLCKYFWPCDVTCSNSQILIGFALSKICTLLQTAGAYTFFFFIPKTKHTFFIKSLHWTLYNLVKLTFEKYQIPEYVSKSQIKNKFCIFEIANLKYPCIWHQCLYIRWLNQTSLVCIMIN